MPHLSTLDAKMNYIPALDGIRALAIIAVMTFHIYEPWLPGGFLGVDIFFVLSGFLITRLLQDELRTSDQLSLSRFYVGRLIRLYPTLLLVLVFVIVAAPAMADRSLMPDVILAALYLTDLQPEVIGGLPIGHTWSLSVEERFYLLWPFVLPWLLRRRDPAVVLFRIFATLLCWRLLNIHWFGWIETYHRFDTSVSTITLGCWLGLVRIPPMPRWIGWAALALIALMCSIGNLLSNLLMEVISLGLIVAAVQGTGPARFLSMPAVTYVGKLSYGLYLWHFPICFWMFRQFPPDWAVRAGAIALTILLSVATYHMVDVPLQVFRRRLRSGDGTAPAKA